MRALVLLLAMICIVGLISAVAFAEAPAASVESGQTGGIRCEQVVFCAGVKDRAPVGVSETFPSDVFSVYCFTTIVGAEDTTAIMHNWYYRDTKVATVDFSVASDRWRTWSSKRMMPDWQGPWRVDVTTADGAVIASGKFTLE
jgi:hypothetical protein